MERRKRICCGLKMSVKGQRKANQGNQGCDDRNDKEHDSTEERTDPKGRVSLPSQPALRMALPSPARVIVGGY
jgi:hypothetical protein